MIELRHDQLRFSFPEVHPEATLGIGFQRTLRIPDDGRVHRLPPGLGAFPLRHVDDHAEQVPASWVDHGGVMLPMYQSEALWISFRPRLPSSLAWTYPFAIEIAAGKINAVTGETWTDELGREPQSYVVVPGQPWLDGYAVEKGVIRQFVAMPLGAGYSAEEQITGEGRVGGLQIRVHPLRREVYEQWMSRRRDLSPALLNSSSTECLFQSAEMGLAPGGRMRQHVHEDEFELGDWSRDHSSRCFVHLANSMTWRAITGDEPPTTPPTAAEYDRAGLPWFEYYSERPAVEGGEKLRELKSVREKGEEKGDVPLPENEPVEEKKVVRLREGLRRHQVREWT